MYLVLSRSGEDDRYSDRRGLCPTGARSQVREDNSDTALSFNVPLNDLEQ